MAEKGAHSEKTPQDNLNPFLITVYQKERLHMVMFKTTLPEVWMIVIRSRITINLSLQLTKRRGVKEIFTITLSGSEEELKCFCKDFDQMTEEVLKKAGGAAAQENQQGRQRIVAFKLSRREVWQREIKKHFAIRVPFQQPEENDDNIHAILSNTVKEVEWLLEVYDQMVITSNQEDEGAAAQENPEDDVEQLKIEKLEIEKKK